MGYVEDLLGANERIIMRQRQHWYALVGHWVSSIIGLLFWVGVWWLLTTPSVWQAFLRLLPAALAREIGPILKQVADALPAWVVLAIVALYALSTLWGMFTRLLSWLNNEDILTSRRIVQVYGVFSKTSKDSSLDKINDIVMSQPWLGRILGFGHIAILTASEAGQNVMPYLVRPLEFKRALLDAKHEMQSVSAPAASAPAAPAKGTVPERLAQLDNLRQQKLITEEEYQTRRSRLLDEM